MNSPDNPAYQYNLDARTIIATLFLPFGEWVVDAEPEQDKVTIRRKRYGQYGNRTGLRRILLVDGGEV